MKPYTKYPEGSCLCPDPITKKELPTQCIKCGGCIYDNLRGSKDEDNKKKRGKKE